MLRVKFKTLKDKYINFCPDIFLIFFAEKAQM